jgi:predicted amidohydrolase YtcJ
MACNSRALEVAGIHAETPDPDGGVFQRKAGGREPNGVLEETAMFAVVQSVPMPTADDAAEMLEEGLEKYAAEGITTAQDGASFPSTIKLLRALDEAGKLPIDVVAYPLYKASDEALVDEVASTWRNMGRFRLGGIKLVADGSIQGYTAYLTAPYYKMATDAEVEEDPCQNNVGLRLILGAGAGKAAEEEHSHDTEQANRGYPGMSQEQIDKWLRIADEKGIPLLVHCNGDATIDMLIEAVKKSRGDWPRPDLRTTIIHSQTIRDDQLNFAASHGLIPSYFPIHVVFWGDRHRDLFLGPERAARINPARSTLDRGMKFTLHHDAPIAHWGMLPVVSAAVNRVASSGKLLGPEERITPYEALRAVTKDAAWQYFEEHRKGTLEPGKLADLVILEVDPTAIESEKIGDIQVLETIKEGKTVYRKK